MANELNNSNPPTLILDNNHNITNYQNPTGSESVFTGSWGSSSGSSSLFNTSFGSDLDSNETDNDNEDDEFIAELTRQMADYMFQEEDNDNNNNNNNNNNKSPKCFVSPNPISQNLNLNQNQHRVELKSRRRRKGKVTESTHQMKSYGPLTGTGSGMRAIFLNGSGSNSRSTGTGVFLPRSATDSAALNRKKSGCSSVLVPTRVLQALEQHFNNKVSLMPSTNLLHIQPNHQGQRSGLQQNPQVQSTSSDHLDRKLPREWTY